MSTLRQKLQHHLSTEAWGWLLQISDTATDLSLPLYLVGGIVRDILLGRSSPDLDLVVEGSGITLAKAVHGRFGGDLVTHPQFGTANWRPPDNTTGIDIDFVTARTETYAHPASLPDITPSTIEADLFRRDFTINAMAVRLDGAYLGTPLDQYNGRTDLTAGQIRILHDVSFIDDPTRMWRGVRFEQRLGFTIEPHTLELLHEARPYLSHLSGDRIRHELILILAEENPYPALARLAELQILAAVSPALSGSPEFYSHLAQTEATFASPLGHLALTEVSKPELRLICWLCQLDLPNKTAQQIEQQLNLPRRLASLWHQARKARKIINNPDFPLGQLKISQRVAQLTPFSQSPAVGLSASCQYPANRFIFQQIETYYTTWRHITPQTNGRTLRQLGLPPGPIYRDILWQLTAALLDGQISTPTEESSLLAKILADQAD